MEKVRKILGKNCYIRDNLNPSLKECDRIASLLEKNNKYHKVICFPNDDNFNNVRDDLIEKLKNKHYIEANKSLNFEFLNIDDLKLSKYIYRKGNSFKHAAVVWAKKKNRVYRLALKTAEYLKIFAQYLKILLIS